MASLLARLYSRRIINVNVNILLANTLAVLLTAVAVHFSRYIGLSDDDVVLITLFTFTVDIVFDVAIYYGLHFMANHWPNRWWHTPQAVLDESPKPSFFRDATRVQVQRMCLSPVFYGIAIVTHQVMLRADIDRVVATFVAFGLAIAVTRTVHTFWMLWDERRTLRKYQAAKLAAAAATTAAVIRETVPATSARETTPSGG